MPAARLVGGHADVPLDAIARISTYRWPWWGGYGARIAKGMVAFVPTPGTATLLELTRDVTVHVPAHWDTRRVLVAVQDHQGFADAPVARMWHDAHEVQLQVGPRRRVGQRPHQGKAQNLIALPHHADA